VAQPASASAAAIHTKVFIFILLILWSKLILTMTAANKITIARILLVPLFIVQILLYIGGGQERFRLGAILCFALAAGADGLDGYVARRFNQKTELGAILDPLADKLLLVSAIVVLSLESHRKFVPIPLWLVVIVLIRETILLIGMAVLYWTSGKFMARPRLAGKMATVLQVAAVLWTLLKWPQAALPSLTAGAGLFVILSGLYYLGDFMRQFRNGRELIPKSLP
jgi:CDP-diacylglycerol--glycerol-3-phosphate 3-phosphatidyltransferase